MQNQSPNDSDPMPLPMPRLFSTSTIITTLFLAVLATWCFSRSNWIGGSIDVLLIVLNITMSLIHYRAMTRLVRRQHDLLAIQKFLTTPVFVEDGNSMILTFTTLSDRLMDEMKKIAEEASQPTTKANKK